MGTFGSSRGCPTVRSIYASRPAKGDSHEQRCTGHRDQRPQSEVGFEDAIKVGISRAHETLRGVKSAWVKEQSVTVDGGTVTSYRVDMLVTFLLEGDA